MPRPTKLTDACRAKILDGLRMGLTRTAAAGAAGIHVSQIGRWYQSFASFATECDIAEAQAEARFTLVVTQSAANGSSSDAIQWLKCRRPNEWGAKVQNEHSGGLTIRLVEVEGGEPEPITDRDYD